MSTDVLLLLYGCTLFSIGYVITIFTHSLWFAAALAYVWWFQSTVLAHFREPNVITSHLIDIFVYAPSCLLFGVATALALLWVFGTNMFPLLWVDAWRVVVPERSGNAKSATFRLSNWTTIAFMLALLLIAVSIDFISGAFLPDLITQERISVLFGIVLIVVGASTLVIVFVTWYMTGGQTTSLTPRLNILYAVLFAAWLLLPPLTHHLVDAENSFWRFVLTELVLTALLIATIFIEKPYITISKTTDGDTDIRYVTASKIPRARHILRWLLLLWLPLTILYITASIARRLSTLAGTLFIFTITILFIVFLYTLFFTRVPAPDGGRRSSSSQNIDIEAGRDEQRPPTSSPSQASSSSLQAAPPTRATAANKRSGNNNNSSNGNESTASSNAKTANFEALVV